MDIWKKRSLLLVGGFTLFRLFLIGRTGLGDSESYYWTWSRYLDFSYYDHPPVTAYLIRLFTAIGSDTSFWTRLPGAILFVGICWLIYRIAITLFGDEKVAFWALLIFNLCPIFSVAAMQMVPDVPAAFFWLLFTYLVIIIVREDKPLLWYPAGAVVGLGLLSKYMLLPLIPSTLLMLAWHGEYRKHLKQPHIYLGGVLGLVIFSPVLIWNYINNWPSFGFHLMSRHQEEHFQLKQMGEFLGGQALYQSPLIWIGILYVVYRMASDVLKERKKELDTLFWLSTPPLLFYYFIGLWSRESEPHWTAFGLITPIIAWAAYYVKGSRKLKKFTHYAVGLAAFMVLAFYIHLFYPILPIKPKYDIVNEVFGWDKVAEVVERKYGELPGEKGKFVMAHHWVMCSQMSFSTQNRLPVYCLNDKTDQFDFFPEKNPPLGADFVYLADLRFKNPPGDYYKFQKVEGPEELEIYRGGKVVRRFFFYKVYGFAGEL